MNKVLFDKRILKQRGLVTNGFCLPYNPELIPRANELRKNMTSTERKLWNELLKDFPLKVMRQKVIDNYIVDFYCAKLSLVIEIDGDVHDTDEAKIYDQERTIVLESYSLKVIRFRNSEIEMEFDEVCQRIMGEYREWKSEKIKA